MKRTFSEHSSDSCDVDGDDVFSDDNKEEGESCGLMSRKKRRGIIEKRRRDRINNSLTELRRLVPTAFEKQGSAKLEKAEILQMTVDHLKMLHSKGWDALSFDPHKVAMDYHSLGFRECAAECARYLVSVEGLDLQDPLRLRLMSHLQCFSAQRDLAQKQAQNPWSLNPTTPSYPAPQPAAPPPPPPLPSHLLSSQLPSHTQSMPLDTSINSHPSMSAFTAPQNITDGLGASSVYNPLVSTSMTQLPNRTANTTLPMVQASQQYNTQSSYSPSQIKSSPYRPWGTELAY